MSGATFGEMTRRNDAVLRISLHTRFDNGASAEIAAEREGVSLAVAEAEYDVWLALVFAALHTHRVHAGVDDSDF
ncbi:hypothetical protein [Cryobacterium sp. TMT1-66-1]|uniref:hypothetical protein n=1 Tax=Cryobacterium sp. TMT1-66-1 TaxID=1259242 RepID=UPI00106A89CB|nr:hypothetical protein [Cryobacterium sp. TMT1-66-1]TFD04151.1 hypothetical protein E3T29_15975 [Cryobacterium sp. TMT1-66-1]